MNGATVHPLDRLVALEAEAGELVERGEGGSSWTAEDAATWRGRGPVAFGRERLGSTYWTRQEDILKEAREHARVAVRSANSMGKNFATADLMAWWVFARGGAVLYMAPTDRQLDIGMRELRRALRGSRLPFDLFHRRLRVRGDTRLFAFTSNSADSLRGFHDPDGLLVVIDEGQGASVEAVAYDAAFSCATAEGDRILVLGNPAHPGGRFHAISRLPHWRSLRIPASEHPNIREGRVVIRGGPAPDWPERIAQEYGKDSPFYTAFVDAEFPDVAEDSLVRPEWLERARELHGERAFCSDAPLVLGLDPARLGPDSTVLCIRRGMHVREFVRWRNTDTMSSAERTRDLVRGLMSEGPVAAVHVDMVGLGAGVLDRLMELLPGLARVPIPQPLTIREPGRSGIYRHVIPRALGFDAGKRAGLPERFVNLRAQGYWHLRKLLEEGRIALPQTDGLAEELLATRVQFTTDGRVQIEGKEQLKARLGRSPDLADALVISLADELETGRQRLVFGTR